MFSFFFSCFFFFASVCFSSCRRETQSFVHSMSLVMVAFSAAGIRCHRLGCDGDNLRVSTIGKAANMQHCAFSMRSNTTTTVCTERRPYAWASMVRRKCITLQSQWHSNPSISIHNDQINRNLRWLYAPTAMRSIAKRNYIWPDRTAVVVCMWCITITMRKSYVTYYNKQTQIEGEREREKWA